MNNEWLFFTYDTICHFYHFKVYTSVAFSTFAVLCNHQDYLVLEHFITLNRNTVTSPYPSPSSSAFYFYLCGLPILDISYPLNHTICDVLCLASNSTPWDIPKRIENNCSNKNLNVNVHSNTVDNSRWWANPNVYQLMNGKTKCSLYT